MKVAVVYGQKHHGTTYRLTQMLLKKLPCTADEIGTYFVNDLDDCVGCVQCIMKDEVLCPHREKTAPIIEAIEKADVVIFATPNYCFDMSGQMKSFCDHMAYRWMVHRPYDMRKKIGVAIATAAGAGAGAATKSIKRQFFWWSMGRIYRLNFTVSAMSFDEIPKKRRLRLEKRVDALANRISREAGRVRPALGTRILFAVMKGMHKNASWNEVERAYWEREFPR